MFNVFCMQLAELALRQYDLPGAGVEFVRFNENLSFKINAQHRRRYQLRIHEPASEGFRGITQQPEVIRSELLWLDNLASQTDLGLQRPHPNREGELVTNIEYEDRTVACSLLTWVDGQPLDKAPGEAMEYAADLGAAAAVLHSHGTTWPIPKGFLRPEYGPAGVQRTVSQLRPSVPVGFVTDAQFDLIEQAGQQIIQTMEALGQAPDCWGLIHADLSSGNCLVHKGKVYLIDFSLCGFGHYLFELGCCAIGLQTHLRRPFVDGYLETRPIRAEVLPQIEAFALLSVLSCFAFHLTNPSKQMWLQRRMPEVAETYCRQLLGGESFLWNAQ